MDKYSSIYFGILIDSIGIAFSGYSSYYSSLESKIIDYLNSEDELSLYIDTV